MREIKIRHGMPTGTSMICRTLKKACVFALALGWAAAARAQAVEELLRNTDVSAQTKAREAVADDPYRPLYHVSAPRTRIA
tara:strand:+ start:155 stop:397 length:243 start_codon:yes stop_codon:yes gene_type:complete